MDKLNHRGTKTIETDRLILRSFKESDYLDMYQNWANSEKVTKFLTWLPHENADVTKGLCRIWEDNAKSDDNYNWIVTLKNGTPVGNIGIIQANESISEAVIGYCYGEKWWGKGIGTESFKAVIDYLFGEVGFNRIYSYHDVKNPASGKVMEKSGLKYEGTKRQADINNNGGLCDICEYAILKSDWLEMQK